MDEITSHFRRRCIPADCVAKILNMLDIHAFSRLVSRAPQYLKLRTYFLPNPYWLAGADAGNMVGAMGKGITLDEVKKQERYCWVMATKDQLLLYLKEHQGNWVSGELISNNLAVSRSAIWKHIHKLKEEGYIIESAPKKGYLLSKASDPITADEIREGLCTKVFGRKNIIYLKETDSTNTRAKELAAQGAPEGTLVIAEKQTKGRGRRGRSWFSPPGGGIYCSLILRPAMQPGETPRITLMTAVVLAETLIFMMKLKLRIKWPNDILANGKKLAGILTEISTEMDAVNYIVVGLGMNVNTRFENFSSEIKGNATSILIETGKQFSRIKLIQNYLKLYEKYYSMFKNNDFKPIMNRWRELADIIGKQIRVNVIGKTHTGKVVNVDNDGVLILKDDQGRLQRIFSGDVTLARQVSARSL